MAPGNQKANGKIRAMSYWRCAQSWAARNTKTYSVGKAVPSILAALAQYRFFGMRPMKETGVIILTLIGS